MFVDGKRSPFTVVVKCESTKQKAGLAKTQVLFCTLQITGQIHVYIPIFQSKREGEKHKQIVKAVKKE